MTENNYGFVRVASAIPELRVADCDFNAQKIEMQIKQAAKKKVRVICFPELSITGYTCGDLFYQDKLLQNAEKALLNLMQETQKLDIITIVGMPLKHHQQLFNVAVIFSKNKILGIVPKLTIPNNNEFYEKRWFQSGFGINDTLEIAGQEVLFSATTIFEIGNFSFGIEICEDLWSPIPPSSQLAVEGAKVIFNLSASNELVTKNKYREQLIKQQSARCRCGYVYSSSGFGESTTDIVFSGVGLITENGTIISKNERFKKQSQLIIAELDMERIEAERLKDSNFFNHKKSNYNIIHLDKIVPQLLKEKDFTLTRTINPYPFIPSDKNRDEACQEIFSIQTFGLAKRWEHTKSKTLVVGISGGLDSTLALLVAVKTADFLGFDRKRIIGVTMPGFGTTNRTYDNSIELMKSLGITTKEISIKEACIQHFKDISHDINIHDVTYENVQARERTQILMDLANKEGGLVIGTGDLSEMALGWSTYNGDHMSMYAVNNGVPKTLVKYLVKWVSNQMDKACQTVLLDIIDTPVSPELLPYNEQGKIAQKTEDIVGPYELHDFFLYYFVRYGFTPQKIQFLAETAFIEKYKKEEIEKWLKLFLRRFFSQQFKRSCVPDGPKVGSINLSPRGDWRMPSDAISFSLD